MQSPSPPLNSILIEAARLSAEEPWPGLASFGVTDAAFFHGRETETLELYRLIKRGAATLIFGKSGLGKTSLLQAGLFQMLRKNGFIPVFVPLDHGESAPSLADQLQAAVSPQQSRKNGTTLWEYFHYRKTGQDEEPRALPVVVLDQFEEIFTLGQENVARRHRSAEFFQQLADLIENNCPASAQNRFEHDREELRNYDFDRQDFKIIISMREEFLAFLEEARQPLRYLLPQRIRLVEMSGSQALESITKSGGNLFDPGVAESVVRFLAGADAQIDAGTATLEDLVIAPALLSLVCSELNRYRRARQSATISEQMLSGNREQILDNFYERCFLGLNPGLRDFVEDLLLTKSGYRNSMAVEDAVQLQKVSTGELEILVERRLLRHYRRGGADRIEITHDILVGPCRRSRDLRHLRDRGWWSKAKMAANYTEKVFAIAVYAPLLLFVICAATDKGFRIEPPNWLLSDLGWQKDLQISPLVLLPGFGLWMFCLFGRQRVWIWWVRFFFQSLWLIGGLSVIFLACTYPPISWQKVCASLVSFYLLVIPSSLSLLHLWITRCNIFTGDHKFPSFARMKHPETL